MWEDFSGRWWCFFICMLCKNRKIVFSGFRLIWINNTQWLHFILHHYDFPISHASTYKLKSRKTYQNLILENLNRNYFQNTWASWNHENNGVSVFEAHSNIHYLMSTPITTSALGHPMGAIMWRYRLIDTTPLRVLNSAKERASIVCMSDGPKLLGYDGFHFEISTLFEGVESQNVIDAFCICKCKGLVVLTIFFLNNQEFYDFICSDLIQSRWNNQEYFFI